jgi:hypothetical protein
MSIDRAHTNTPQNNALVTHWTLLTLRVILKAENWPLDHDKLSGHSGMDEDQTIE